MSKQEKQSKSYYQWKSTPDFSKKTGIHHACLFSVQTDEGDFVELIGARKKQPLEDQCCVEILGEGPFWDCMRAATDTIVSQQLKDFLVSRTGKDLEFLPTRLVDKQGSVRSNGYYAVRFKRVVKAYDHPWELDEEVISGCKHTVMVLRGKGRGDYGRIELFMDADLAEEMIAAGFTGLGFENRFSNKKPGRQGKKNRDFPEEKVMEDYEKEHPSPKEENLAARARSIKGGWKAILEANGAQIPLQIVEKLKKVDVTRDLKEQVVWLEALLLSKPPAKTIRAFWFGLYEQYAAGESDEQVIVPTLYICGGRDYSEETRYDFDWARGAQWHPDGCQTQSEALVQLYRLLYEEDDKYTEVYCELSIEYVCLLIRFAMRALSLQALAKLGENKKPVAVGFDEGDGIYFGTICLHGWAHE